MKDVHLPMTYLSRSSHLNKLYFQDYMGVRAVQFQLKVLREARVRKLRSCFDMEPLMLLIFS